MDGFDLPRGAGDTAAKQRKAIIPDPPQRREPRRRPDAPGVDPLPQPRRRQAARLGPAGPALRDARASSSTKHYQWMIRTDYLPRICARGGRQRRLQQRPQGVRGRAPTPTDVPTMPIEFSVAAFRLGHSMIRARLQLEPRSSTTARARSACCSCSPARRGNLGRQPAAAEQLDRRLPPPVRLRRGRTSRPRRARGASSTARCASTRRSSNPLENLPRVVRRRGAGGRSAGEPRVPEPDAGEDGQARHGPADGRRSSRARASPSRADARPAARRHNGRRARRPHRSRSARRC